MEGGRGFLMIGSDGIVALRALTIAEENGKKVEGDDM
jgi:hypothetical protein